MYLKPQELGKVEDFGIWGVIIGALLTAGAAAYSATATAGAQEDALKQAQKQFDAQQKANDAQFKATLAAQQAQSKGLSLSNPVVDVGLVILGLGAAYLFLKK